MLRCPDINRLFLFIIVDSVCLFSLSSACLVCICLFPQILLLIVLSTVAFLGRNDSYVNTVPVK